MDGLCAQGNVTRYMNHSTVPNVRPMVCNHFGCRRVVFYTLAGVKKGAELTYDYGYELGSVIVDGQPVQKPCLCGEALCRKRMY